MLFDTISPVVRPVFGLLPNEEQHAFEVAYRTITERLMTAAEKLLPVEDPRAARDRDFIDDPLGPAGAIYPINIRRIANARHKPKDPASQFFGPYEASAELTASTLGDAWNALRETKTPFTLRQKALPDQLGLLSLPAALDEGKFNTIFFADRYSPYRSNPFSATVDRLSGELKLRAHEELLADSRRLTLRSAGCLGFESLPPSTISPVNLVQALGVLFIRKLSPELQFLEGHELPHIEK